MKKILTLLALCAFVSSSATFAAHKKARKTAATPAPASTTANTQPTSTIHVAEVQPTSNAPLAGVMIRPMGSYQMMNPKSLNNYLQTTFDNNTGMKIGNAFAGGAAIDIPLYEDQFYMGVRMEYFTTSSDSVKRGGNVPGNVQATLSGMPTMLTATYMYPVAPKWRLGTTIGGGFAFNYRGSMEISGSNDANRPNGTATWGATPITGLGAAFINFDATQHIGVRLEGGYRILSASQIKATDQYGTIIKAGDPLVDNTDTNVAADANAFFTGLSLVVTL
ncbi:acid shock protein [Bdellovibrionota bacterium FG-1]